MAFTLSMEFTLSKLHSILHMVFLTALHTVTLTARNPHRKQEAQTSASTSNTYSFSHILLARNSITMRRMSTHRA